VTSSQAETLGFLRLSGIRSPSSFGGFVDRRATGGRGILQADKRISPLQNVDRTDDIGVVLVSAFHASEQRLRAPVVRRDVPAERTGWAGVVRRHVDKFAAIMYFHLAGAFANPNFRERYVNHTVMLWTVSESRRAEGLDSASSRPATRPRGRTRAAPAGLPRSQDGVQITLTVIARTSQVELAETQCRHALCTRGADHMTGHGIASRKTRLSSQRRAPVAIPAVDRSLRSALAEIFCVHNLSCFLAVGDRSERAGKTRRLPPVLRICRMGAMGISGR
jgi:hypothetical protein